MRASPLFLIALLALPVAAFTSSGRAAAPGCPAQNRQPIASARAGAPSELVPPAPETVLVCRYTRSGSNRLIAHRILTSAHTVSALAAELNALPASTGTYSCPADFGAEIVAWFRYGSGPEDPVSVDLTGCNTVTNGPLTRLGLDRPVIGQLAALVPLAGTIRGHIELCGGPAPGRCWVSSFGVCDGSRCWEADRVAIFDSPGRRVADVRMHRGRFAVQLAPGRYTLRLLGDGRHVHGKVIETARATVHSERTTTVAFAISVP